MTKRMDTPDTVDTAIHFLAHLQAEGWGLAHLEQSIEYGQATKKGMNIPVGATVTIHLRPSHPQHR